MCVCVCVAWCCVHACVRASVQVQRRTDVTREVVELDVDGGHTRRLQRDGIDGVDGERVLGVGRGEDLAHRGGPHPPLSNAGRRQRELSRPGVLASGERHGDELIWARLRAVACAV